MDSFWKESGECIEIRVRVSPNASNSGFAGIHNGRLKVRLNAKPVEGAANKALIKLIAKEFKTPKSGVSISRGARSREKTLTVTCSNDVKTRILETLSRL